MTAKIGILVQMETQPGKGDELGAALAAAHSLALEEHGTVDWIAFKTGENSYGILDTFADEAGQQAHMAGEISKALGAVLPGVLAAAPDMKMLEILASK